MSQALVSRRPPVDPTSTLRQARMRALRGAPVKAHLEPQLRARLERCAARQQLTLADLLRQAILEFLEAAEHATTHAPES